MFGSLGDKVFGEGWLFSLQRRRQKVDLVTALRQQVAAERRRYPHRAGLEGVVTQARPYVT